MELDLDKLEKILKLEAADNFKDRKVFKGLSAFIAHWTAAAIKIKLSTGEARLVEQVSSCLTDYAELGPSQREAAINEILTAVKQLPQAKKPTTVSAPPVSPFNKYTGNSSDASLSSQSLTVARKREAFPVKPSESDYKVISEPLPLKKTATVKTTSKENTNPDSPLNKVKGIGDTYAKLLEFIGLKTVRDALYFFPFRHEDFSSFKKISELMFGRTESIMANVLDVAGVRTRGGKELIEVVVSDETGTLRCIFFNRRMIYGLKPGSKVVLSGRVEQWGSSICLKSPSFEQADRDLIHTGRLVPIYHTAGPIKVQTLRRHIKNCVEHYAGALPEHLPPDLKARNALIDLPKAVEDYHFPPDRDSLEKARRRLAFDEFFLIQVGVLLKRQEWQEDRYAVPVVANTGLLEKWYRHLPYKLTEDQQKAVIEVLSDLKKDRPMHRLIQGDVGSGKTIVAATALLMAVAAGFQGALMAPTQILAEQHYQGLKRLFESFKPDIELNGSWPQVRLELLTGNVKKKEPIYRQIGDGQINIVIGTQALIQEGVEFDRLGLVITDEQHRFGVMQRSTLKGKGEQTNPHVLSMTATPIPRSLALTIYGDLDLTVIEQMPPGRTPIRTKWVLPPDRSKAYNFIRKEINKGRQAFIICPLVEESEKIEAKAAVEEHARLEREVYSDLKLALLHGRMKPSQKDTIMSDFRDKKFDILVSTSVIEVGIDIPNASVILIEGADRFGLAQLHQFRGRVGRGQHPSFCLLLATDDLSEEGQKRLKVIEETSNGFVLAEEDLKLRGPGEFFGTRQSGVPDLRVAGIHDTPLLELARKEAALLFEQDPGLLKPEHALLSSKVAQLWNVEGDLS